MGNDTSRIWSVFEQLDVNHDGRLSQKELEDWFKDEQFVGNPLFDQSINGFQTLPDLASRFIKHVRAIPHSDGQLSPSGHSESLSFEDLRSYCADLSDKDISHLTMSLFPVASRREFAVKQIFDSLDVNKNGYLDSPEVELLLNHLDPDGSLSPESRSKLKSDLIAHESNKVVFSDLLKFFSDWPLREIRTRTEKLREHAKFVRQHSVKPHRKKTAPLESIHPSDLVSLNAIVDDCQAEIDGLTENCIRLHTESVNLNAAKRSINEDSRSSDSRLIQLDKDRLVQANRLTDIQQDLTSLHKTQLELSARRSLLRNRIDELERRTSPANETLAKLQRDNESVKDEMKRMQDEIAQYSIREKNIPPKNRSVATQISDFQSQLHALEKNLLDVQQLIPIFEKEFSAIRKQMEDEKKAGKSVQTLEIRHKTAVENKFNALRKSESELINQHQELQSSINKAAQELKGDDETQLILSKLNDLRKQVNDRKEILLKFQAQTISIQKEIGSIEVEQKNLAIELTNIEKKESLLANRVSQQTELYAETENQLASLSIEKDSETKKFKEFIRQHDSLTNAYETIENELKELNGNIELLIDKQEEAEKTIMRANNSNSSANQSPIVAPADSANRNELLDFLQLPHNSTDFVVVSRPASVENSPALLPAASSLLQIRPSISLKLRSIPVIASVDCEFGDRRTHGIVNVSQYLLRYENSVPLHTFQLSEEGSRICLDVTDIIDLNIIETPNQSPNMNKGRQINAPMPTMKEKRSLAIVNRPASLAVDPAKTTSTSSISLPTALPVSSSQSFSSSNSSFFGSLISSLGGALQSVTNSDSNKSAESISSVSQSAVNSSNSHNSASNSHPVDSEPHVTRPNVTSSHDSHHRKGGFFDSTTPLYTLLIVLRAGYRNRFLFNAEGESAQNITSIRFNAPEQTIRRMQRTLKSSIQTVRQSVILSPNSAAAFIRSRGSVVNQNYSSSPGLMDSSFLSSSSSNSLKSFDDPVSLSVAASESILLDAESERVRRQEELARLEESEEIYLNGESDIVNSYCLKKLIRATPERYHLSVWKPVYSLTVHGVSFNQFISIVQEYPASIIIFQDSNKKVFGGYASAPFLPFVASGGIYYGTGESFVFDIRNRENDIKSVFLHRWTGENDYFLFSGETFIAMGGGSAFAWQVDQSFKQGTSGVCSTFDSPILSGQPNFSILTMEVWAPTRDQTSSDFLND